MLIIKCFLFYSREIRLITDKFADKTKYLKRGIFIKCGNKAICYSVSQTKQT